MAKQPKNGIAFLGGFVKYFQKSQEGMPPSSFSHLM
jgi:hypothetical protein